LDEEKLKVAIVGFGKMGILHASILNVMPDVKLVAICEKSGLIRRFLKRVFKNVDVFDTIEELSELPLDTVYVTTPIPSHFPIVKSIYANGISANVFVEKTLASNFNEAKEICDLAKKFGGANMVGYMRRFSVTFRKTKDLLNKGVIGEPVSFAAYAYSSDFFGIDKNSEIRTPKVGVLRDLGCHAIDLALWFFGDFKVKDVKLDSLVNECSEDSVHFEVEALNGVNGQFNVSWCVDKYRMPEIGFLIEGHNGFIKVSDDALEMHLKDGEKFRWYRHDLGDNVDFWLGTPEYFREDRFFIESTLAGQRAEPDFISSSKVDLIIDEVKAKAKQNG
jgi:predicted dehydrogenase